MLKRLFFIGVSTVIFLQLFSQDKKNQLTSAERIFYLSQIWSEVKHSFVYYNDVRFSWDSLYSAYLEKVSNETDVVEYFKDLRRFLASLGDGHTSVEYPRFVRTKTERSLPFSTELIEDKVIITNIWNDSLRSLGIREGVEIKKINGVPVFDFAKKYVEPYVAASSPQGKDRDLYSVYLLAGDISEPVTLELGDYGRIFTLVLSRRLVIQILNGGAR